MAVYEIEHPKTGQKITLEGEGMPSDADIREAFAMAGKPQQKAPAITPQEYSKQLVNDPKYRAAMAQFIRSQGKRDLKQEAVRRLPFAGRIADAALGKYADPVYAERTVDETLGPQVSPTTGGAMLSGINRVIRNPDKSLTNLAYAMPDLARGAYDAVTSPEQGSTGRFLWDTAKGIAAPTGLVDLIKGDMNFPEARGAWENDALGSGLMAFGALKGGMAAPRAVKAATGSLADLGAVAAAPVMERTAPVFEKAAGKLTDMTLKQPTTLKPFKRDQNIKTALEGDFQPNAKGVEKLKSAITGQENKIADGIASANSEGVRGTFDRAKANIEALRDEANRSSDPVKNNALIDAELERLSINPMKDAAGTVGVSDLQKMKVAQGREIAKSYGEEKPQFQNAIDKARVRGFKEEMEISLKDTFPELATENKKLGAMYDLQKQLERAASRIENREGIGFSPLIKSGTGAGLGSIFGAEGAAIGGAIGTLIAVIEHPSVAPRLAQQLYKASKGMMSKAESARVTRQRLAGVKEKLIAGMPPQLQEQYGNIKDKLKDKRGLVGRDINETVYYRGNTGDAGHHNSGAVWYTPDKSYAEQYGAVTSHKLSPKKTYVLDSAESYKIFTDNPSEMKSLSEMGISHLDKQTIKKLKGMGYDSVQVKKEAGVPIGYKNGDSLIILP